MRNGSGEHAADRGVRANLLGRCVSAISDTVRGDWSGPQARRHLGQGTYRASRHVCMSSIPTVPAFPIMTARLLLRLLGREDFDGLAEVYLHPLVMRWIGSHTREDVRREIASQLEHQRSLGWSLWAVEDRRTGRMIGDCGLQPLEHRGSEVELGYDLHPDTWLPSRTSMPPLGRRRPYRLSRGSSAPTPVAGMRCRQEGSALGAVDDRVHGEAFVRRSRAARLRRRHYGGAGCAGARDRNRG